VYEQIDIFSDLIALQLGVIHPTVACASKEDRPGSIDEALASMSNDDSRACRRKFRKLFRKRSRPEFRKHWSSRRKRSEAMLELRQRAWSMVKDGVTQDNDEV
jgi:hypothetical protein